MKREYVRPEYDNNNQLADIILVSVNAGDGVIEGNITMEELIGIEAVK